MPITSSMKETKVSVEELKDLVNDYKRRSPFESKCVWISKELLDELAKRNEGHAGFRIYFAGFEWNDKDQKNQKEESYEKMQKIQVKPSENAGPKKYQGLIFVSTDKEQEDQLKEDNYVIVGEKIEQGEEVSFEQLLKICPPPPPTCRGDL